MKVARFSDSPIFLFVFIPLLILLVSFSCRAGDEPVIRVGLVCGIGRPQSLTLVCDGKFDVSGAGGPMSVDAGKQAVFTAKGQQVEIAIEKGEAKSVCGPIRLVPKDAKSKFSVVSPKTRTSVYKFTLEISANNTLKVINEMPLEDYVRGVVPAEVPKSFHPEAQKALTVAIRTYALRSRDRHKSEGFNVCDGTNCQVFAGAGREAPWVDALVDTTRGQVAVYDGELIYTTYSTDCGGATQSSEDYGIGSKPYLRSVVDAPSSRKKEKPKPRVIQIDKPEAKPETEKEKPKKEKDRKIDPNIYLSITGASSANTSDEYCACNPNHTWSKTFTTGELNAAFKKYSDLKIGEFKTMKFTAFDKSGRVKTVLIKGDKGECAISGSRLRTILGPGVMKSTMAALDTSANGSCVISGKGYGHGMGLCAFGANGLAKSDDSITYIDILQFYYKGIEVVDYSKVKQ